MATILDTRIPPAVWTLTAAGAQALIAGRGQGREPRAAAGLRRMTAAVLAGTAIGFGTVGMAGFLKRGTALSTTSPARSSQLVTEGAHGVTRNPMYLALGMGLGGLALWTGRPATLLPAVGAMLAIDRFQVEPEERVLAALFGPDYEDYRARVPRWVDARTPDLLLRAIDDALIG